MAGPDGALVFRYLGEPSEADVEGVAQTVATRVGRMVPRWGWEDVEEEATDPLSRATALSLQSPLAFGGAQLVTPEVEAARGPRCA